MAGVHEDGNMSAVLNTIKKELVEEILCRLEIILGVCNQNRKVSAKRID